MKYSIIWRPHKINCTKVLIRFYMSLTFQQFTRLKPGASLAMSMNHDQTWLNGIWLLRQKTNFIQFPFSWVFSVKSHSLLSSFRWLVCCRMELLWMWVGYSFTGSHSHRIRYSHYYQDFLGENITTTAITQITHYLVSADQWIDKWLHFTWWLHFPNPMKNRLNLRSV